MHAARPVKSEVLGFFGRRREARAARAAAAESARSYDWSELADPAPAAAAQRTAPPSPQRYPAPGPSSLPSAPHAQSGRPLPLEVRPAPPQDLLRDLIYKATDMLGRPVNSRQAVAAFQQIMHDLSDRARAEHNIEQRTVRNQAAMAKTGADLVTAASVPGVELKTAVIPATETEPEREVIPDVVAQIKANALRASDPTSTAQFQPITDGMPDPRIAPLDPAEPGRVVAADVVDVPGVESSPVHTEDTGTLPAIPAQHGPVEVPLPQREHVGGVEPIVPGRPWADDETHVSAVVAADDADDVKPGVSS